MNEISEEEIKRFIAGKNKEAINHPTHYNRGKFEVIEVIEDWQLGFHLGNVIKYIARAEHKSNEIEDLKKARFYLDRYISIFEAEIKLYFQV